MRELPETERPRERLARLGHGALADAELVAILLRTGREGCGAVAVARELIGAHGSLSGLARCSVAELARVKGVGPAKAAQLVAAFGLGSRLAREQVERQRIDSPELVYGLIGPELAALRTEHLRSILLDTRYRLLRVAPISEGSVNESVAHPREILRPAILHAAFAFILTHNHPSGDPTPSEADLRLTRRIAQSAELMQIQFLDHVIIGSPAPGRTPYYSFKEAGLL